MDSPLPCVSSVFCVSLAHLRPVASGFTLSLWQYLTCLSSVFRKVGVGFLLTLSFRRIQYLSSSNRKHHTLHLIAACCSAISRSCAVHSVKQCTPSGCCQAHSCSTYSNARADISSLHHIELCFPSSVGARLLSVLTFFTPCTCTRSAKPPGTTSQFGI